MSINSDLVLGTCWFICMDAIGSNVGEVLATKPEVNAKLLFNALVECLGQISTL